nr:Chain C, BUTYRATE RESPONSE FACTOR 2 [Homo sapiens]1W0W_C Chain C, BUTYRATE RESPONSE FACTOR 2 [Homo sapiens]
RRLPIFSRL